ncbi:tetratricopeptide repeat protein [Yoonia sp. R2331]|uniref:tetratricopeptide repeat-containing glycosyltransferase family protein n=1 Tax=Yoonia sp. R2331 TaxID=3237238 RepID=UPI0034E51DDD
MAGTLKDLRQAAVKSHQDGAFEDAARGYAQFLAQVPGDVGVWSNLGVLHRVQGRHAAGLRAQERAIALDPNDKGVRNNLANILSDLGQYDRSLEIRRGLLQDKPDDRTQKAMIGRCLRGKGDYAASIAYLTGAISDHPDDPELQLQLAFAQLGAGDYANALQTYKARWAAGELQPRDLPFPEWQGEPLGGKTIVVLPEQGFGDAVLFARFLPVLKDRGAKVQMVVKPPLTRLFADLEGVDQIITELTVDTTADYWVNMMDLAAIHFAADRTVPAPAQLHVPQAAVDRAAVLTGPHQQAFKVGVIWTGSVTYKGNAFRSFSHRDFLPLTDVPGVKLFSLYKGPELAAYYADGSDGFIVDAGSSERDFADCAAMMQAMDLVITSDTATAHIAGSLGVPTWTVLHWDPFWVWRHEGETTEWYPGMRLFRQAEPMDWGPVHAEVRDALDSKVKGAM